MAIEWQILLRCTKCSGMVIFVSKDSKTGQRASGQHPPTKIIVEGHYVGAEKWKRKREYSIIGIEKVPFHQGGESSDKLDLAKWNLYQNSQK